jgi:uncharacterized protein (TIGR02231 family)
MKLHIWLALFFCCPLIAQNIDSKPTDTLFVDTQLTQAVLYFNAGQITRSAKINLPQGSHLLCLRQLPDNTDANTLQFNYIDGLKIESVQKLYSNDLFSKRLASATIQLSKVERLQKQIDSLSTTRSTYVAQRKKAYEMVLDKWSLMPAAALNANTLETTYSSLAQFDEQTLRYVTKLDQQKAELQRQIKALADTSISKPVVNQFLILLSVVCNKAVNDSLHIEYFDSAKWTPLYEAHISDIDRPTNIQLFAQIQQNTGIDWKNVPVTLVSRPLGSLSLPADEIPRMKPLMVNISDRGAVPKGVPPIFVESWKFTKGKSDRSCLNEDPEKCKIWVMEKTYSLQQTFLESRRRLDKPISLKQGTTVKYPISQIDTIPTRYEFFANSRNSQNVYLNAYLKNWQQHQLPPGALDIYLDGFFAQKINFSPSSSSSEEVLLHVGKVDGVYVERSASTDDFKQTDARGNKHTVACSYKVRVINNRKKEIQLTITDRIPISQTVDVTVTPTQLSGATLNAETGFLTWQLSAKPQRPHTLNAEYEISYPKDVSLELKEKE